MESDAYLQLCVLRQVGEEEEIRYGERRKSERISENSPVCGLIADWPRDVTASAREVAN